MNKIYISTLFLSCIHLASFGEQRELAHFFLATPGEYVQDTTKHNRKNLKSFIDNPEFDGIMLQFIIALASQQNHIFISYETWDNFKALKQHLKSRIHKIGIIKPKRQLYMPNKTKIPDQLQNALENSLIFDKNILEPYKNMFVELSWIYRNLLYFRTASQQTKILHPKFSNVLSPLFVFHADKWDMYETNMGLYYLTPHKNMVASKSPIALEKFKKIHPKEFCFVCHTSMNAHQKKYHTCIYKKPKDAIIDHAQDAVTHKKISINCTWAYAFTSLFKPNKSTSWTFYFTGHGGGINPNYHMLVCALPQKYLRNILHACNTSITTYAVYLNSCYTFPERLVALYNNRDDKTIKPRDILFNFHLITTTRSHKPSVEITILPKLISYHPKKDNTVVTINLDQDYSCLALAYKTAHLPHDTFIQTVQEIIAHTKQKFPVMDQCLLPAHTRTVLKA